MFSNAKFIFLNLVLLSTCQALSGADDSVVLMTTVEPIDGEGSVSFENATSFADAGGNVSCANFTECSACRVQGCNWIQCKEATDKHYCSKEMGETCSPVPCFEDVCANFTLCEECVDTNCSWVSCGASGSPFCMTGSAEQCPDVHCDAANITTTTVGPDNATTTTELPTSTTTEISTSTLGPETTTTTDAPNDTTTTEEPPTTAIPTTTPSTTSSTTRAPAPAPATGGFSAGSFFGGITLTLALLAIGYGGFKFYKTRYDVNYRTL